MEVTDSDDTAHPAAGGAIASGWVTMADEYDCDTLEQFCERHGVP